MVYVSKLKKSLITFNFKKLFTSFVSSVWSQRGPGLAVQAGPHGGGGGRLQEGGGEVVHGC